MNVCGELSYATQDPWVFSGTLRDNILFQNPYEEEWYEHVVEACALKKVGIAAACSTITKHFA